MPVLSEDKAQIGFRCKTCNHLWAQERMAFLCEDAHKRAFRCDCCGSTDLDRLKDSPFDGPFREDHHLEYECERCGHQGYQINGEEVD